MIFLFVFFFITLYLYCVERFFSLNFWKQFVLWLPAFIIFAVVPSLQYNVGTDYSTYFQYYFNNEHALYLKKNEILYYYIVELGRFLGDPQFQFILVSIIQAFLFFYLLFLLKIEGYKSWLIFLIFFLCTGIYHNQMNGLRQYICIYAVPIIAIHLYKRNNFRALAFSVFSLFLHASSVLSSFLLLIFSKIKITSSSKYLFLIFVSTFFIYLVNFKSLIIYILEFFNLRFLSYMGTQYTEGRDVMQLVTKFYYLPIIAVFWYYFLKNKDSEKSGLNNFFILIFSFTHFMFLQAMSFDMMLRIWAYFNIFLIFPIYYVFSRSSKLSFLLLLVYVFIFYIAKVLFFPVAEYEYHLYRGWF
ncbi:EpsG family protein [Acinetobacter sp. 3657]|uniref:EpsG family protein n=1 Tax=Acinetobacter sp. 3657 TaxID=2817764 RepID=UPI00285FB6DF|nr:hypothetical protein [Prolinoborus sp. 3657]